MINVLQVSSEIYRMKKVAILATDGFEHSELSKPQAALKDAGHETHVVSLEIGLIEAAHGDGSVEVDKKIDTVTPDEYDALLLPGGVVNPDILRMSETVVSFVKHFIRTGKPIAAICHGSWTLINADGVNGRRMTSWRSLKVDLQNAGAVWIDEAVVVDGNLVTSRKPEDIPAFNQAFLKVLA